MWLPPERFVSWRVALRPAVRSDSDALFAFTRDAEVMQYLDWPMPQTRGATVAHLEGAAARWYAGDEFQWIIEERASGQCVGTISFRPDGPAVDFGYFLGRPFWRRGYAYDAATTLLGWFGSQPDITRVQATVDTENLRSRLLLERLGLELEGIRPRATIRPNLGGPPRDTAVYARACPPLPE